jgi:hypothetical protein
LQKESCQPFEQLDWKSFLVDWRKKEKYEHWKEKEGNALERRGVFVGKYYP